MTSGKVRKKKQVLKNQDNKTNRLFYVKKGFDLPFLTILFVLMVIGLVCLYSASYARANYIYNDSYYFIKRQIMFAVVGIATMLIASTVDYHIFHKLSVPITILAYILLVAVLLLPARKGVHRWISFGGFSFQPSEIAKFAVIILFAHIISINHKKMKTFKVGFLPFILILGSVGVLMLLEPHLSGTMLIMGIGICMMYAGGTRAGYIVATALLAVVAVMVMAKFSSYVSDRFMVWRDPEAAYEKFPNDAYQIIQSLYAIGSGGLMGRGLGQSAQKHMFLPEAQNDFIFSIVCEELGLVGALVIIIIFILLVWRGITIGMKAKDKFGSLLAIGLSVQIGLQALLNIGVVTNTIPNTGISLPFFSYGGTSLLMLLAQTGIILSVSRQSKVPEM